MAEDRQYTSDNEKLVRDRIPEIIRGRGESPIYRTETRYPVRREFVIAKLREEAEELIRALKDGDIERISDEAADVYETVLAALALDDMDAEHLREAADRKRAEKGAFNDWVIWSGTV